ncbi:MAG: mannosyl-3-phosphoglycerate synthase [Haliscomenobacter sp.]|uniref:mannosyl-3-phosphoglycerate synthase n=1 Tax=Haliscomenobacter sp. TaxID=2717303 RepID=UPI0029B9AC1C|nr:mannosyl-3-phosphoglycerate synthase [Haliscomenobacter sp.]MDX2068032.1 mannosyl-3-phosphoglycerate synthase [Haliscomenobacter sp.]
MRLEIPTNAERFGANLFYEVQKIYELEGGYGTDSEFDSPFHVIQQIPYERLYEIEKDLAIVIPVKDERLRLLEGVLCGIPHNCLPIVVSNSKNEPIDRYRMERNMVDTFCRHAKKKYIIAHQRSAELARIFKDGGYPQILDDQGLIRHGKAEGMLAGIALAHLAGKKYVGFIDSDNYFPGAVFEYVRIFSAGLSQGKSPYSMVRIQWHSKPKIVDGELFFTKWGRVSRITNQYLNLFLSHYTGYESEVLRTGNAGEHALSMPLALSLDYSTGFSVETHHFVSLMEKFGGVLPSPIPEIMKNGVEVFQIESRNPHFHDAAKGDDHIQEMIEYSLSVLWHSSICPKSLKKDISNELSRLKIVSKKEEPIKLRQYPVLSSLNFTAAAWKIDWQEHGNFSPS